MTIEGINQIPFQKKSMSKKPRNNPEVQDLISNLPDHILHFIISHLSTKEIFRTRILSKHWTHLWKNVSHFDFDYYDMVNHEKPNRICVKKYARIVNNTLQQHQGDLIKCSFKDVPWSLGYGVLNTWIEFCVERKNLRTLSLFCDKIKKDYFKPNLFSNLSSLKLTNYHLEDSILPAFEGCSKLKILKLNEIIMLDSVVNGILKICSGLEMFSLIFSEGFNSIKIEPKSLKILELRLLKAKDIVINVEKLKYLKLDNIYMSDSTINKILENCFGLEEFVLVLCGGFNSIKIANKSLKTLVLVCLNVKEVDVNVEGLQKVEIYSIHCPRKSFRISSKNLQTFCSNSGRWDDTLNTPDILANWSNLFKSQSINIFRNLRTLSIDLNLNNTREALRLSHVLKSCSHLNTLKIKIPEGESATSRDCALPYPKSMFWETQENYFVFFNKLQFVTLKRFSGKVREVIFAKFLITRSYRMEKMYVKCDDTIVDEAKDLLLLLRGSNSLSIILS